ncbi:hypothetical protein PAXINDRAFT_173402 [Paxillus involutus ATCC 200175]|uniref:Uncharacterized protein n=1 Tax=Paxillus involutus ATCC 200175 TaxID=664439 RepID=A0A0C9SNB7_PAXIN|nr:hypothetical protein PAXINDRAFT_173402 [Paxillus involutus ATCC 200175]
MPEDARDILEMRPVVREKGALREEVEKINKNREAADGNGTQQDVRDTDLGILYFTACISHHVFILRLLVATCVLSLHVWVDGPFPEYRVDVRIDKRGRKVECKHGEKSIDVGHRLSTHAKLCADIGTLVERR